MATLPYVVPLAPFLLLIQTPAAAEEIGSDSVNGVAAEHVWVGDLDLHTHDGWHDATSRLSRAAMRVCAVQADVFTVLRCHSESIARAKRALIHKLATHYELVPNDTSAEVEPRAAKISVQHRASAALEGQ